MTSVSLALIVLKLTVVPPGRGPADTGRPPRGAYPGSAAAGDVFHGAVAFGELRDWPFEWILVFANAVAAM
jgi:sugar/nucleoside kinase (ribokinase family)